MKSWKLMFYRNFLLYLLFLLSSKAFSTEYQIQAEIVEIDTQNNLVKYLEKVTFNSNEISFKANKLIVNQNNEQIDASGSPIELSFKESDEMINGQANRLQIIQNTLYLRDNVIIFRQGNEIKTQEIKIILKEND
ncbi:MAG: LptA/OstA family protein [Gammaproteobacteria bacterium]